MTSRLTVVASLVTALLAVAPGSLRAEDEAVYKIEMNDGKLTPMRLEVPAGKPFKLEVTNAGASPAEFESKSLHKEKVIAPKATTTISVKKLSAGDYDYFDENQPKAPAGVLVAK